ncbi:hypothetical protein CTEN210_04295 [Chaetoceros tenuissimus]|uniref:SAYSvFN domain-containing protein n=1 Tax=Chaetoceros tenuissimus TaxID=426638 RepID=A0AAD3CNC4_9STRA|nr:hypothetical protein CTEN210_04295 [Chaetoceros tenuissimus]
MPPRKRISRELWDKARKANKKSYLNIHLFKAILYELQPIDVLYTNHSFENIPSILKSLWAFAASAIKACWKFVKSLKRIHYLSIMGVIFYWKMVKYLHELLDAGPSILILTVLALIFTIGLGDSKEGLSAYSVFNKGFQSIMGGVDANALLNQHVGGGMAFMNHNNRHENEEHDDGYRQRQQRQQQRDEQRRLQQERDREVHERRLQQQQELDTGTAAANNGARISNKKSRRKKNIELRREMRQQRQAARAMGFVQDGHRVDINAQHQEQLAMNHLIQEQIGNGDFEEEREEL